MEALAAIGLSSNILQFIELTAKLVSTTQQISDQGAKGENLEIETIAHRFRLLGESIAQQQSNRDIDDELKDLCQACVKITDELLPILHSLKLEDNATTWQSFQQGLRTIRKADKIEGLQKRLDRIGKALNDYLLVSQQELITQKLNQLATENYRLEVKRTKDIEALQTQLEVAFADLRRELNKSREMREEELPLFAVMNIAGKQAQYSAEQFILEALRFPGIDDRYEGVQAAHHQTFSWVFEDDNSNDGKSLPSFRAWLTSGHDLFWISGKPGSGKSTLMKYLCENVETELKLRKWAGDNQLITANFFFWSAAKRSILKSQEGLLRSLLYQMLRQSPELISRIYPHIQQFQPSQDGPVPPQNAQLDIPRPSTSVSGLLSTLRKLCEEFASTSTRMCFFIDGLDEYGGRPAEIIQLVEILRTLPNLKLCISSRPWNEFEHSFGQDRPEKLYMELLNRGDIQKYVYDKFMSDRTHKTFIAGSGEGAKLISEIIEGSQGVFLWVVLVVRSFHEGLINGDRVEDLRERLQNLPSDLNVYFDKILLADVEQFYRPQACRIFQAAVAAHSRLPLCAFWYIGTDRDDYGFDPGLQPMTLDQLDARQLQLRKILNARCKGLLEVHQNKPIRKPTRYESEATIPRLMEVDFLHRTVKDFLVTPETQATLASWDRGVFKPDLAICHALLAQLRTAPKDDPYRSCGPILDLLDTFFRHCRGVNDDPSCDVEILEMLVDGLHGRILTIDADKVWSWYGSFLVGSDNELSADRLRLFPPIQLALVCVRLGLDRYLVRRLDTEVKREAFGRYLAFLLRQAVVSENESLTRTLLKCGISPDDVLEHHQGEYMTLSNWVHLVQDIWMKGANKSRFCLVQILLEHGVGDTDAMVWSQGMSCREVLRQKLPAESMSLIEHYFLNDKKRGNKGSGHHRAHRSLGSGSGWGKQTVKSAFQRFRDKW